MEARRWIGTPYRHQASIMGAGTDCLGLVRGVWRGLIGAEPESPPAYTEDWSEASGKEELLSAAERWLCRKEISSNDLGDVILFRMRQTGVAKHLGLTSNRDGIATFIHSYTDHGVIETAFSAPWQRKVVARFAFPQGVN